MEQIMSSRKSKTRKRPHWKSGAAFFLGLLSANNIVYLFVVGSTPIYLVSVYALVLNVLLFVAEPSKVNASFKYPTRDFLAFLLCIGLSAISLLLYNGDYSYQYVVGLINLFLFLNIIGSVILLKEYVSSLMMGIAVGVAVNFCFVLYAYYSYSHGTIFSLSEVFPATGMLVSNLWNDFRAFGVFREAGHLMRFLALMLLPLLAWSRALKKPLRYALLITIFAMMAVTRSSTVPVLLVILFLFWAMRRANRSKAISGLVIVTIAMVAYAMIFVIPINNEIILGLRDSLLDPFSGSSGNTERATGMSLAFSLVEESPILGHGWSTLTPLYREYGYYSVTNGSFSFVLSCIVEIGIGVIPFVVFLLSKSARLIKRQSFFEQCVGGALFVYCALAFITDWGLDAPVCIVIALVFISIRDGIDFPEKPMIDRKAEYAKH